MLFNIRYCLEEVSYTYKSKQIGVGHLSSCVRGPLFVFLVSIAFGFKSIGQSIETVIQRGHELAVVAVSVSPDSNYVVTGSRDKSAKLWELSTGREVRSFLGHDFTVTSVDISSDGKYLLTGSNDETVRLWEMETGKEIFSINPVHEQIKHVAISPDIQFFVNA